MLVVEYIVLRRWVAPAVSHVAFFDQIRNIAGGQNQSSNGFHCLADRFYPFRVFSNYGYEPFYNDVIPSGLWRFWFDLPIKIFFCPYYLQADIFHMRNCLLILLMAIRECLAEPGSRLNSKNCNGYNSMR